jgi:hypothetical protein
MNMFDLPKILFFNWDEGNTYKSVKKHGVTNRESEEVFFNKPIFFFQDKKHSQTEKRFLALGKTNRGRLLALIFTLRNDALRVISARSMNKKERSIYEKQ